MNTTPVEQFIAEFARFASDAAAHDSALWTPLLARSSVLRGATVREISSVLDVMLDATRPRVEASEHHTCVVDDKALVAILSELGAGLGPASAESTESLDSAALVRIERLYQQLGPESRARRYLLRMLAADASRASLAALAEAVAADPPREGHDALIAMAPLMQRRQYPAEAMFPRLLDAIAHKNIASVVLDVTNHVARKGIVRVHPAAKRVKHFAELLTAIVSKLERIEQHPDKVGLSAAELQHAVSEAMALVIGLCDALGLIGDKSAAGKLHQVLELSHRRLRTEAAAALARLGDEAGTQALIGLAGEPPVRTIALFYLDELGMGDSAAAEHRTPEARAEGELAAWLAMPGQFGIAPHSIAVIDSCSQHWPGYAEAVDCYLVRYELHLPRGRLTGVGIVGPVVWSMAADLEDLPPADIYAIYAGWHAEHEDIQETDAADLPLDAKAELARTAQRLVDLGLQEPSLVKSGRFFGESTAVFSARRGALTGSVVVAGDEIHWFAGGVSSRPIGPDEAYFIYKGRSLLRAFNP